MGCCSSKEIQNAVRVKGTSSSASKCAILSSSSKSVPTQLSAANSSQARGFSRVVSGNASATSRISTSREGGIACGLQKVAANTASIPARPNPPLPKQGGASPLPAATVSHAYAHRLSSNRRGTALKGDGSTMMSVAKPLDDAGDKHNGRDTNANNTTSSTPPLSKKKRIAIPRVGSLSVNAPKRRGRSLSPSLQIVRSRFAVNKAKQIGHTHKKEEECSKPATTIPKSKTTSNSTPNPPARRKRSISPRMKAKVPFKRLASASGTEKMTTNALSAVTSTAVTPHGPFTLGQVRVVSSPSEAAIVANPAITVVSVRAVASFADSMAAQQRQEKEALLQRRRRRLLYKRRKQAEREERRAQFARLQKRSPSPPIPRRRIAILESGYGVTVTLRPHTPRTHTESGQFIFPCTPRSEKQVRKPYRPSDDELERRRARKDSNLCAVGGVKCRFFEAFYEESYCCSEGEEERNRALAEVEAEARRVATLEAAAARRKRSELKKLRNKGREHLFGDMYDSDDDLFEAIASKNRAYSRATSGPFSCFRVCEVFCEEETKRREADRKERLEYLALTKGVMDVDGAMVAFGAMSRAHHMAKLRAAAAANIAAEAFVLETREEPEARDAIGVEEHRGRAALAAKASKAVTQIVSSGNSASLSCASSHHVTILNAHTLGSVVIPSLNLGQCANRAEGAIDNTLASAHTPMKCAMHTSVAPAGGCSDADVGDLGRSLDNNGATSSCVDDDASNSSREPSSETTTVPTKAVPEGADCVGLDDSVGSDGDCEFEEDDDDDEEEEDEEEDNLLMPKPSSRGLRFVRGEWVLTQDAVSSEERDRRRSELPPLAPFRPRPSHPLPKMRDIIITEDPLKDLGAYSVYQRKRSELPDPNRASYESAPNSVPRGKATAIKRSEGDGACDWIVEDDSFEIVTKAVCRKNSQFDNEGQKQFQHERVHG